ncbi:MAG: ergothioneine biosynthesis protein EgtB [Pirellulaceae bacterium]
MKLDSPPPQDPIDLEARLLQSEADARQAEELSGSPDFSEVQAAEQVSKRKSLLDDFRAVRRASTVMCEPLAAEDFRVQPSLEVSPPWWNLGHTSWFFARNVLQPLGGQYTERDRLFDGVLNSYYASLGQPLARQRRGLLTRPTTLEIYEYRHHVDARIEQLIGEIDDSQLADLESLLTIGIQHEQQHQELFYYEIKAIGASNPLAFRTAYTDVPILRPIGDVQRPTRFLDFAGGLVEIGHSDQGWCWDNELPVHKYFLRDFRLQERLITNGEFLEFMEDSGYREQLLWLNNGWNWLERESWRAPLYWESLDDQWMIWTLGGMRELNRTEPVCHVSFYEADAYARWKSQNFSDYRGARLPSEQEWEHAARASHVSPYGANFLDSGWLHPTAIAPAGNLRQMLGDVWEWTASYYGPYGGYQPFPGALAEYNGKFMDNQRVLRGGSCVTPRDHIRISYRNFWTAETRFPFAGFRLAQDA